MGDVKKSSLEFTIFSWGCAVGFLFCLFTIPIVFNIYDSNAVLVSILFGSVAYPVIYFLGRSKGVVVTYWPMLLLTSLLFSFGWLMSDGISGSTPFVLFLALLGFLLAFPARFLFSTVVTLALVMLCLLWIDWFRPHWVHSYGGEFEELSDLTFTYLLVFIFGSALLVAIRSAYERERNEVARQNLLLKKREAELEKAKSKAEANSKAKSDFLSVMSHEIRTPLNAVLGLSEFLELEESNKETRESLHTLRTSANSLLSLVNDILDFSKIEEGRLVLENTKFDLTLMIRSLVDGFLPQASEKQIDLDFEIDPHLSQWVEGDPLRLSQILNNLLGNALKFTKNGSVLLRVRMKNSSLVEFSVEDTGIGVPKEKQEMIFQRFSQVSSSTTREYGGTGLGLAICLNLVTLMKGKMGMESELGQGSRFYFSIQLPKVEVNESLELSRVDEEKFHSMIGKKVLVVEDNPVNVLVVKKFLERWKLDVIVAVNGKEGVQGFIEEKPDLVLMDLQMPVMDGMEATRKMRELEAGLSKRTPIVALTASVLLEDREIALEAGMDDYLPKPFRAEKLRHTLLKHLDC